MWRNALILILMLHDVLCRFLLEHDRTWNENDSRMHCVETCSNSCCSPQPEFCDYIDIIWGDDIGNQNNQPNPNHGAPKPCAPTGCECKPCNRLKNENINEI